MQYNPSSSGYLINMGKQSSPLSLRDFFREPKIRKSHKLFSYRCVDLKNSHILILHPLNTNCIGLVLTIGSGMIHKVEPHVDMKE